MANTKVWLLGLSVLFYASGCFVVTDPPAAPEQPSDVVDSVGDPDSAPLDLSDTDDAETSSDPAICDEGEPRCHGRELQSCGDDLLSWDDGEACEESAECRDGECLERSPEIFSYCNNGLVSCPPDLVCQLGLCLANWITDERGEDCLVEEECEKPLFCNGLGVCSGGTESDGCLSDLDCRRATPVCNPFSRSCSAGGLGSACVPTQGCDTPWICGPEFACHTGLDGSPCFDESHCALASPICGPTDEADDPTGQCQDGEHGDPCDGPEHCAGVNLCSDGLCRTPGEGDACDNAGDCPSETAPFCDPDGFCCNGSRDDRCYDDDGCMEHLVCGPGGLCQLGAHGEPCDSEADCSSHAPICFSGSCQDGGLNDNCENDVDCGPSTPFCGPSGLCQIGATDDLCDGEEDCIETLVCRDNDRCGGALGDGCATEWDCGPDALICTGWGRCDNGTDGALCRAAADCNAGLYCESNRCFDGSQDDLCSEETQCFGSGLLDCVTSDCISGLCSVIIEPGNCVTDDTCYSEGAPAQNNPCVECDPSTNPFGWTSDDENTCPVGPHATSSMCSDGVCVVTGCEEDWGDCDIQADNGCETATILDPRHCGACDVRCGGTEGCAVEGCEPDCGTRTDCDGVCRDTTSDPAHCGACDSPCGDSSDPSLVSVCTEVGCAEQDCPDNTWNVDGDPSNGCEYDCVPTGEEDCNGIDDNCDGTIDEGFGLDLDWSDAPQNCGECGHACNVYPITESECLGGECFARMCDDGFHTTPDASSCEENEFIAVTLWVDASYSLGESNGSEEAPYTTISDALAMAGGHYLIQIAPGYYTEHLVVDIANVTLAGDSSDEEAVTIDGVADENEVMLVTADRVWIRSLKVRNAPNGIVVDGQDVRISHVDIEEIGAPEQTEAGETLATAYGLVLNHADRAFVSNVFINNINGASADFDGGGSAAVGLVVINSDDVNLVDISSSDVVGGDSPLSDHNAPGGSGTGVWIRDSQRIFMHQVDVETVTGGSGTNADTNPPGAGGQAVGIHLENADNCHIEASSFMEVTGGVGGNSDVEGVPPGAGGLGVGMWFDGTTDCTISSFVLGDIEGGSGGYYMDPISGPHSEIEQSGFGVWIEQDSVANEWPFGDEPSILSGMHMSPYTYLNPQFLETLYPVVVLYGVADVTVSGLDLSARINPTNWGKIAVFDSERVVINDVTIANQTGVAGATLVPPSDGLPSTGIHLNNCEDCVIDDVRVTDLTGGWGGLGGIGPSEDGADGGDTMAVGLYGNTTATISRLLVHGLEGGNGGYTTDSDASDGDPGTGICVYAQDTAIGNVDRMTCFGGDSEHPFTGASVLGSSPSLDITDSILSELSAGCLPEGSDRISLQYSVLHTCDIESADPSNVTGDPLFTDAPDDFHVTCDDVCSPAVDAGAPDSTCGGERPPSGGRVNAGYYGNTGESPPNPESEDVFPCPL